MTDGLRKMAVFLREVALFPGGDAGNLHTVGSLQVVVWAAWAVVEWGGAFPAPPALNDRKVEAPHPARKTIAMKLSTSPVPPS
ncbi:MAG: hypothetical protein ABSG78_19570 [Verrucomicrobiota bacterium]|jgi:hypothetical protein